VSEKSIGTKNFFIGNFFDLNIAIKKIKTVANVYNHICNKNQLKKLKNVSIDLSVKNLCISIKDIEVFAIFLSFITNIFALSALNQCGPIKNPKQCD